jgi:hypothetical protein
MRRLTRVVIKDDVYDPPHLLDSTASRELDTSIWALRLRTISKARRVRVKFINLTWK